MRNARTGIALLLVLMMVLGIMPYAAAEGKADTIIVGPPERFGLSRAQRADLTASRKR